MEIRRDFYLDQLIKRKNNGLIKVITGVRRCEKSYLLNNLFYHHLLDSSVEADHIIHFAFNSADVIYNEPCMRGYSVDVDVVTIAEKDSEGKVARKQLEVDFVCNLGSSRYYIQSTYSLPDEAKRTQEIRPFRKIDNSFKKIVITKDIVPAYYDEFGILTANIYDFLLDSECLEK